MKNMRKKKEHLSMSYRLKYSLSLCLFLLWNIITFAQTSNQIRGRVVDEQGEPIVGATIMTLNNPSTGTVTDISGKFTLNIPEKSQIKISYLGYKSITINVKEKKEFTITMHEDTQGIDEVVIVGYGSVKKSDLTGSVSVVKTEEIKGIPVARIDQMLQGRMAGVDIMSTGGDPGAGTSIRIRGTRSITASNEPLYVVDGVIDGISDLSEINPSDIQSIEVLKDASSTAIYGSRGANGVILISTKNGGKGKTRFSLRTNTGFAQLPQMLDIMNAEEFAILYNDYKSLPTNIYNTGTDGAPTKPIESLPYVDPFSLGVGTNWVDVVTQTALYTDNTFSASGGSDRFNYYFSTNYNQTEGIIKNTGTDRIQFRTKIEHKINKYIKTGININYAIQNIQKNPVEIGTIKSANVNAALALTPLMKPYNDDGTYNDWNPIKGGKGGVIDSPIALADLVELKKETKSLFSSFYLEINPLKDLYLKSTLSYRDNKIHDTTFYPSTLPTKKLVNQGADASQAISNSYNILNENTISYRKKIARHSFDALYGFTYQKKRTESMSIAGKGYPSDDVNIYDLASVLTKENLTVSSSGVESVLLSNLARINYNFDNRYYLTATARIDGASNFSKNNKWAFFPSAALKWNVKNESFLIDNNIISRLSLRLSTGVTGNQGIAPYSSLSKLVTYTNGYMFNDVIPTSTYMSQVASDNLTWETTLSHNIGVDLGLFNNRIIITADGYYSKTKDLLLTLPLPNHTGFSGRIQNIGKTSNKGIEVSINSVNIDNKNFKWNTMITISHNKQMVEDIGGYDRIPTYTPNSYTYEMYGYQQGYPVNALWGMVYAGTWKSREEIDENKVSKKYISKTPGFYDLGWPKYIDQDNNGIFDRNDVVYLGSSDPTVYGGFSNNFNIFGFQLNIHFNYSIGGYIFNPLELSMGSGDYQTGQYRYMTNSWHPVRNPNSDRPRANAKDFVVSTYQRHDASYLRLKDISLAYSFDLKKITNGLLRNLTLSASANNVYLWKYYNGFDPEVSSPNGTRRVDLGAYPPSRTIVFGAQLDF